MDAMNSLLDNPEFGKYHKNHPTAQQIVNREGLTGKLTDKVILITGASSGIGIDTARALYHTGAHLFLAVRDTARTEKVKQDIETDGLEGKGKIDLLHVDMDSLDSVRQCAADFLSKSEQLNVLVCNGGVMGTPEGKTKDGFETQFGVNYVAHFLLFQLLKDALLASSTPQFHSRVVVLSSSSHDMSPVAFDDLDFSKRGYNGFAAYAQSKTANAYMSLEIERRFSSRGLHSTSVHPGGTPTALGRHLDPSIIRMMLNDEIVRSMKTVEQGAATTVWAAVSSDWEGTGGRYLEDCSVAPPKERSRVPHHSGYAAHIYDTDAAQRLWTASLRMVGLKDDQSA